MKIAFSFLILFFTFKSGLLAAPFPPDTTVSTSLMDKSSAILMLDQGKQLVTEGKVRDALIIFRQAAQRDPQTWKAPFWISYCHFKLSNFGYARQYGLDAVKKGGADVDKDIYEILGRSFHQLNILDSAIIYYRTAIDELSKARAKELQIDEKITECYFAMEALAITPNQRTPLAGDVNSGFNDYAPILNTAGNKLYFTSRRGNTTGGRVNPDDQEYFEDIYIAEWDPSGQKWDSVTNKIDRINTNGFDAMSYLSDDGLYALLTLNNNATDAKKQTKSSDIFEVEFTKKGKWGSPKVINNKTINSSFFEGAATITADRNTMYFVSDRKGDKRSTDLYVVEKNGKKWGIARPVSDSINTTGRETTPYITPDGRFLFFSSDGHSGMGGLDVYVSENLGKEWSKPVNLGAAVNTVNDDMHFRIYKKHNKAFMSGINLQGQKSNIDMYEIELSKLTLPANF